MPVQTRLRRLPLAAEIVLALCVKIVILWMLWSHFFAHPQAPHMNMKPQLVEQHLLPSRLTSTNDIDNSGKNHADH